MTFRGKYEADRWAQRLADYHHCVYVVVQQYELWRVYCVNDLYNRSAVVATFNPTGRTIEFLGSPL